MSGCSASEAITGPSWSRGNVMKLTAVLGQSPTANARVKNQEFDDQSEKVCKEEKKGVLGLSFRRTLLSSVTSPTHNSKSASKKTELCI